MQNGNEQNDCLLFPLKFSLHFITGRDKFNNQSRNEFHQDFPKIWPVVRCQGKYGIWTGIPF